MLRQGNVCGPAGDGSDFDRELSPAKLGPVRMRGSVKGPKARKNLAFWEIKSGAVWPDEEKVAKRGKDWRSEGRGGEGVESIFSKRHTALIDFSNLFIKFLAEVVACCSEINSQN